MSQALDGAKGDQKPAKRIIKLVGKRPASESLKRAATNDKVDAKKSSSAKKKAQPPPKKEAMDVEEGPGKPEKAKEKNAKSEPAEITQKDTTETRAPPLIPYPDTELEDDATPLKGGPSAFKNLRWGAIINILHFLRDSELRMICVLSKEIYHLTDDPMVWRDRYPSGPSIAYPWTHKHKALWYTACRRTGALAPDVRDTLFRSRTEAWIMIMKERKRRLLPRVQNVKSPLASLSLAAFKAKVSKERALVELRCQERLASQANNASSMVDYRADRAAFDTAGGNAIMAELSRVPKALNTGASGVEIKLV
eukprot:CAMPEP_0167783308 /NCGR_PEP_ID=MMETSP0111_2-20121227/6998_1 /TAXON_ID=91324 /ORGANISM="Lotharella globosa, Strain CCCM811" /LENGTH=308 /DNA_ID=CAMNT_0007674231 /DNA_START=24 /DNA_END=950 /DNA_ORIENTATION=+